MTLTKRECRAWARARRDAMQAVDRASASRRISARVLDHPTFQTADTILAYATMRGEVDTAAVIGRAMVAGKQVVVPVTDWAARRLIPVRLRDQARLVPGRFGVPEPPPEDREVVALETLDLVLVPGIAFDARGHRIGYGAGLFDRLLAEIGDGATRWGLAFDIQILEDLPAEPHDVRVHAVVTESRWIDVEPLDG